jgi:hypothetical protein
MFRGLDLVIAARGRSVACFAQLFLARGENSSACRANRVLQARSALAEAASPSLPKLVERRGGPCSSSEAGGLGLAHVAISSRPAISVTLGNRSPRSRDNWLCGSAHRRAFDRASEKE